MNKEELNQDIDLVEDIENDTEEICPSVDEQAEWIALQEEIERIQIQHNPISKVSQPTLESAFYKESMIFAETIGEVFQKLLGYGVDYNNAMAIASGLVQNDAGSKQLKIQQANQEQSQI
jgi:hypothetical protein